MGLSRGYFAKRTTRWRRPLYKGVHLRGGWELAVAKYLDWKKIKWVYEPRKFNLKITVGYTPDFYLPEIDKYLEVKGRIDALDKRKIEAFREQTGKTLLYWDRPYIAKIKKLLSRRKKK